MTAIYSLGMMIASLSVNIKTANLLTSLFYFPILFLSGATIPFELMPEALQKASSFMPLTQGIMLLKLVAEDQNTGEWVRPIIVLSVTVIGGIIISLKTFRWE